MSSRVCLHAPCSVFEFRTCFHISCCEGCRFAVGSGSALDKPSHPRWRFELLTHITDQRLSLYTTVWLVLTNSAPTGGAPCKKKNPVITSSLLYRQEAEDVCVLTTAGQHRREVAQSGLLKKFCVKKASLKCFCLKIF